MIVLVGIGLTYIIYNAFYSWADKVKLFQKKPFSCQFCISFWVALGFFATTNQYPAFIIPIAYELTRKLINRI